MPYDKQTWANDEAGATPLSADRLNHMEDGIDDAGGGGATDLPDLTDVDDTAAPTSGHYLRGDGTAWDNSAIQDADIPATIARDSEVTTAVSDHSVDTTSVHGIADTSVLATDTEVATAVSDHSADTTSVHGIADTAVLETTTGSQTKVDTHVNDAADAHDASAISFAPAGSIAATDVQAAIEEVVAEGGGGVTDHGALTGLGDDDHAQYHNDARGDARYQPVDADLTAVAGLDSATAGAIASDGAGWIKKTYAQFKTALGLVKGDVGLGNADNTSDANKPVSSATQTALDAKATSVDVQEFTTSGTWTKPAGTPKLVEVEIWGAGGRGDAGTTGAGGTSGGGGGFRRKLFTPSELSATETVTIGATGATFATAATNSTFGTNKVTGEGARASGVGGGLNDASAAAGDTTKGATLDNFGENGGGGGGAAGGNSRGSTYGGAGGGPGANTTGAAGKDGGLRGARASGGGVTGGAAGVPTGVNGADATTLGHSGAGGGGGSVTGGNGGTGGTAGGGGGGGRGGTAGGLGAAGGNGFCRATTYF